MPKHLRIAILTLLLLISLPSSSTAGVWQVWQTYGDTPSTISHKPWANFLNRYISSQNGIALFDYGGVSGEDKAALDNYVAKLSDAEVTSFSRDEQFAYWINLYNALTIQLVLDNYPVPSIKNIYTKLVKIGPWYKKLTAVQGEKISLNDIEHRILRPIWKDPRVHYAINCASIGCPNLTTAYTVKNMEKMLNSAAADYINHPRGADVQNGKLRVSSIFKWFQEDFGGNDKGVIAHIKKYASPQLQKKLKGITKISGHHYDWSLNDAKRGD